MKKQTLSVFATLGLMIGLAVASGYAQDMKLVAKIPFNFTVGSKALPAGEYTVRRLSPDFVVVQSADAQGAAIALTRFAQSNTIQEEGKLVFHRYGDYYFLSSAWRPGENVGLEIPKSKLEREMARRTTVAKNGSNFQTVYIAAVIR